MLNTAIIYFNKILNEKVGVKSQSYGTGKIFLGGSVNVSKNINSMFRFQIKTHNKHIKPKFPAVIFFLLFRKKNLWDFDMIYFLIIKP